MTAGLLLAALRDHPAHRGAAARALHLLSAAAPAPLAGRRPHAARLRAAARGVPRLVLRLLPHSELHHEQRHLPLVTDHELRELLGDHATRRRGGALSAQRPPVRRLELHLGSAVPAQQDPWREVQRRKKRPGAGFRAAGDHRAAGRLCRSRTARLHAELPLEPVTRTRAPTRPASTSSRRRRASGHRPACATPGGGTVRTDQHAYAGLSVHGDQGV